MPRNGSRKSRRAGSATWNARSRSNTLPIRWPRARRSATPSSFCSICSHAGSIDDRQIILSILLAGILIYAFSEYARSPVVAVLAAFVTTAGLYFVWMPEHSTQLAELVGIGRGVDLILYIWVCLSLI